MKFEDSIACMLLATTFSLEAIQESSRKMLWRTFDIRAQRLGTKCYESIDGDNKGCYTFPDGSYIKYDPKDNGVTDWGINQLDAYFATKGYH